MAMDGALVAYKTALCTNSLVMTPFASRGMTSCAYGRTHFRRRMGQLHVSNWTPTITTGRDFAQFSKEQRLLELKLCGGDRDTCRAKEWRLLAVENYRMVIEMHQTHLLKFVSASLLYSRNVVNEKRILHICLKWHGEQFRIENI